MQQPENPHHDQAAASLPPVRWHLGPEPTIFTAAPSAEPAVGRPAPTVAHVEAKKDKHQDDSTASLRARCIKLFRRVLVDQQFTSSSEHVWFLCALSLLMLLTFVVMIHFDSFAASTNLGKPLFYNCRNLVFGSECFSYVFVFSLMRFAATDFLSAPIRCPPRCAWPNAGSPVWRRVSPIEY